MKHILVVLLLVLSLGLVTAQSATIQSVTGRVEVQTRGSSTWAAASAGTQLPVGATISTGLRSSAVVQIGGATVQVQALTRMTLDELIQQQGSTRTELSLPVGRVRAEIQSQDGLQQEFRLRSPVATAAVRGTSFDFDGQNLEVLTGAVQVSNNQGQSTEVVQGESSTVTENAPPPSPQQVLEQQTRVVSSTSPGGGNQPPVAPLTGTVILTIPLSGEGGGT